MPSDWHQNPPRSCSPPGECPGGSERAQLCLPGTCEVIAALRATGSEGSSWPVTIGDRVAQRALLGQGCCCDDFPGQVSQHPFILQLPEQRTRGSRQKPPLSTGFSKKSVSQIRPGTRIPFYREETSSEKVTLPRSQAGRALNQEPGWPSRLLLSSMEVTPPSGLDPELSLGGGAGMQWRR